MKFLNGDVIRDKTVLTLLVKRNGIAVKVYLELSA